MGIMRAILHTGTFRGSITTGLSDYNSVNSEKQSGYYYYIRTAGDYSSFNASFASLVIGDLIQYNGSIWVLYHEADYTYKDVDCYNASGIVVNELLFDNLTLATYHIGILSIGKNILSSSEKVYPTTSAAILFRSVSVYGGIPNAGENPVSIMGTATHFEMSMSIKKNGSAQTAGWIPEHSASGTQLNYHTGEDVEYNVDGTLLTGYNTGDKEFTSFTNFKLTNISYAVNVGAPLEELLKVTTIMTFTKTGVNIKNSYEGLIETLANVTYSYMVPYSISIFNQYVSDFKEKLALPASGVTTNVSDGTNRKEIIIYNDTASGTYENYLITVNIPNPKITNKESALTSFIYTYGATYGKFYSYAGQGDVIKVGDVYSTEINLLSGYISDLIAKVNTYLS